VTFAQPRLGGARGVESPVTEVTVTRSSFAYFAGLVLVLTPLLIAGAPPAAEPQTPGTPTAPATSAQPKSTALVLGQVTDGSTGQPIPEAVVLLQFVSPGARGAGLDAASAAAFASAMAGNVGGDAAMAAAMAAAFARGSGAEASRDQRVLTGSDGRFVFHALPAGQYQLSATLNGYAASLAAAASGPAAATIMATGGRGMSLNPPASYAVAEGEILKDVRLRLWKHASVTGTVFDDAGEPAVGITVQAMRRTLVGGRARYTLAAMARTDDRGVYRIGSLLPGDYLIVSPQTQIAVPAAMFEKLLNISMTGQIDATDQATTAALAQLAATPGASLALGNGVRFGGYMVAGAGGALPLLRPDGQLFAYRTAFHADAATPVEATIVSLMSGQDRAGADLHLRLTPTVRVSGLATGPNGPVANLAVRLVVPGDRVGSDTEFDVATSVTTGEGRFEFYGVPPGQFLLRAQKNPLPNFAPPPNQPSPESALFAVMDLSVGARNIDDLIVNLAEAFSVSGRVEFQSETGKGTPASLQGAGVMLLPADGQLPSIFNLVRPAPVGESGTFVRPGLVPGRYFLYLSGPGAWQVKSATVDGRDVYDAPLEIRTGDVTGVVITMTDRLGQLSGNVAAPAPFKSEDATVLLFPANAQAWIDNGMNTRLVRTTRARSSGAYRFLGLTEGDYLVVAIDRSEEGDVQDPAFILALARVATRVTIGSEARTQALTVARVGR
jgi:protocatechuate 3,4-dioxygenase beta subunit